MPTRWEVNVQDAQGHSILVPPDKRQKMDKLDQTAIFFPMQQDKQSVLVPAALAQHHGLSMEQMDAIRISTVSAVPVAQERIGGHMVMAQYPSHTIPRLTKDKKV